MEIETSISPQPGEAAYQPACRLCNDAGYLRYDVPPNDPRFGSLHICPCRTRRHAQQRYTELRVASHLLALSDKTFQTFNTTIPGSQHPYKQALLYSNRKQGWIIFQGPYGCGKTHLAAAIGNRVIERGLDVLFVVVPDMLDQFYPTSQPRHFEKQYLYLNSIRNATYLILDGLGTERKTPWGREKLFQILNYRYHLASPTIITTNAEPDQHYPELQGFFLDQRVCQYVPIPTQDVRQLDAQSRIPT
jgi:DNA replication protein DnaC